MLFNNEQNTTLYSNTVLCFIYMYRKNYGNIAKNKLWSDGHPETACQINGKNKHEYIQKIVTLWHNCSTQVGKNKQSWFSKQQTLKFSKTRTI